MDWNISGTSPWRSISGVCRCHGGCAWFARVFGRMLCVFMFMCCKEALCLHCIFGFHERSMCFNEVQLSISESCETHNMYVNSLSSTLTFEFDQGSYFDCDFGQFPVTSPQLCGQHNPLSCIWMFQMHPFHVTSSPTFPPQVNWNSMSLQYNQGACESALCRPTWHLPSHTY